MTFTVTYRGNDGSMATASIEAKDRSECFVRCKERGIVPTDIREGRAKTHPLTPNALLSARRLIAMGIAGAVALALVIGAWLWMVSGKRPKEEPARPAPPAQAVPPKKVSKTKPTTPPATNHVSRLVRHRKPKTVPTVTAEPALSTVPSGKAYSSLPRSE